MAVTPKSHLKPGQLSWTNREECGLYSAGRGRLALTFGDESSMSSLSARENPLEAAWEGGLAVLRGAGQARASGK